MVLIPALQMAEGFTLGYFRKRKFIPFVDCVGEEAFFSWKKIRNFTKRMRRERKNECPLDYETLKMIVDNSYDEIYVTDPDGKVIYVNNALNPWCSRGR